MCETADVSEALVAYHLAGDGDKVPQGKLGPYYVFEAATQAFHY